MIRISSLLILLSPLLSLGQSENSPDIIWNKYLELEKKGLIDSIKARITFYKDYFHKIDTEKQFYIFSDTLKYSDGYYSTRKVILDTSMEYDGRQIGSCTFYYPSGKIFSKGSYGIGAYTECQFAGPTVVGYNFKIGQWKYWYENGKLMTKGNYKPTRIEKSTSCGVDTLNVSKITLDWTFFNPNGKKTKITQAVISKIDNR